MLNIWLRGIEVVSLIVGKQQVKLISPEVLLSCSSQVLWEKVLRFIMVCNITLLDTADSTYAISMHVFSLISIFLSMSNAWYSLKKNKKKNNTSSEQYASINSPHHVLDLQPHWTKQHVVDLTLGQINPNGYSKLCLTPELTSYASLSSSILIYCWVEWKLWLMGRNHHCICLLVCSSV